MLQGALHPSKVLQRTRTLQTITSPLPPQVCSQHPWMLAISGLKIPSKRHEDGAECLSPSPESPSSTQPQLFVLRNRGNSPIGTAKPFDKDKYVFVFGIGWATANMPEDMDEKHYNVPLELPHSPPSVTRREPSNRDYPIRPLRRPTRCAPSLHL